MRVRVGVRVRVRVTVMLLVMPRSQAGWKRGRPVGLWWASLASRSRLPKGRGSHA